MFNQRMYQLGSKRSTIREIFEYAKKRSAEIGAENVYVYNYDWRLDPIESAHGLHDFIQTVKANSRREKVSIISEGSTKKNKRRKK